MAGASGGGGDGDGGVLEQVIFAGQDLEGGFGGRVIDGDDAGDAEVSLMAGAFLAEFLEVLGQVVFDLSLWCRHVGYSSLDRWDARHHHDSGPWHP